jgi:hypothetical protein
LRCLHVHQNPIKDPPPFIFHSKKMKVLADFFESKMSGDSEADSARVNIIGSSPHKEVLIKVRFPVFLRS